MDHAITVGDVLIFWLMSVLAAGGLAGLAVIIWVLSGYVRGMSR
ncbi:hypothetical protein [Mesorhizobium sp.]|nr:hypothetical protein [Mesorhizobium sp.]